MDNAINAGGSQVAGNDDRPYYVERTLFARVRVATYMQMTDDHLGTGFVGKEVFQFIPLPKMGPMRFTWKATKEGFSEAFDESIDSVDGFKEHVEEFILKLSELFNVPVDDISLGRTSSTYYNKPVKYVDDEWIFTSTVRDDATFVKMLAEHGHANMGSVSDDTDDPTAADDAMADLVEAAS